ncbi:MAG: ribosomal-protein-alanine N-acetyltransferase [Patiriisocius sp.]|jgi:RimJ/RimL family protein N-acetyltransferase
MKPITLETERLLLRPFKLGDEAGVLEFASNTLTQQYTGDIVRTSMEEVKQLIQNVWLHDYATYGYGRFAVIHKEDNKIIGFNGIKFLKDIHQTDLGYRFLPQYWGKGIATESSKAILEYAFTTLKLAEIIAHVLPENPASAKVLEKLAFQKTAFKPYPGETENLHWFALTNETYERQ